MLNTYQYLYRRYKYIDTFLAYPAQLTKFFKAMLLFKLHTSEVDCPYLIVKNCINLQYWQFNVQCLYILTNWERVKFVLL